MHPKMRLTLKVSLGKLREPHFADILTINEFTTGFPIEIRFSMQLCDIVMV